MMKHPVYSSLVYTVPHDNIRIFFFFIILPFNDGILCSFYRFAETSIFIKNSCWQHDSIHTLIPHFPLTQSSSIGYAKFKLGAAGQFSFVLPVRWTTSADVFWKLGGWDFPPVFGSVFVVKRCLTTVVWLFLFLFLLLFFILNSSACIKWAKMDPATATILVGLAVKISRSDGKSYEMK